MNDNNNIYTLLSALCGQSTDKLPNRLKLALISSSSISGGRPPTNTLREKRSLDSPATKKSKKVRKNISNLSKV